MTEQQAREAGEYLFKFQFFVHELSLLKDYFNVAKPAIALRFLDFPTLIIEGKAANTQSDVGQLLSTGRLKFNQGKKCNFKMHSDDLAKALTNKPFFLMFIDASQHK